MRIECAFIVFTLEFGSGVDAHQVNPPPEVYWNRIELDYIVYSSNNNKRSSPSYAHKNGIHCRSFRIQAIINEVIAVQEMNYDGLSQMESCFHKKRQLTKGPHVVRPFVEIHVPHDVYYQR